MSVDPRDGTDEGDSADDDRHSNVVELRPTDPALPRLEPVHVEHLRSSGLSDETLDLAGLYTEPSSVKLAKLLDRKSAWGMGHAIVFPFVDPGATTPHAYRVRPDVPRLKKRKNKPPKPIKYDQSSRLGVLTYYPPRARLAGKYADATLGAVLVEGEKKALALDQLDLVTVGLTGVWNWLDAEHRDKTGEWRLNASITKHVALAGRACTIVYDSDAATNDQVMAAAKRLGHALLAAGARVVRFTTPPAGGKLKGIDDYYAAHGGEATRALVEAAPELDLGDVAGGERIKQHKALANAPVSDALRLPDGYMIGRDGSLWLRATRDDADDVRIARAPILIMRYLDTIEGQPAPRVELCYPSEHSEAWVSIIVQRRVIVDARTMVANLGAAGAPVTSSNASRMVDWLDALVGGNPSAEQIPASHVALRAGWHELDGRDLFVVDRALGDDDGAELAARVRTDDALLSAFTPRGALDEHVAALRDAWQDPTAAAVIAAALAAPLLRPMELANFALHMNGDSSTGKTIRLHIAASIYGEPERIVSNWGASASGLEARAALLCDLPAFYDESGVADPAHVERNLYTLINGVGRPRANADMTIRAAPTWRTVIISTGERALIAPDAPTGAQARVIQISTDVFDRTADEVVRLRERCVACSGAFGREWIQIMVDLTRDEWRQLRNKYIALVQRMCATAKSPVQARLAAHYAALALAESIAAIEHGIGDVNGRTMLELYQARTSGRSSASQVVTLVERGRDLILDWLAAEPEAFAELSVDDKAARTIGRSRAGFRRDGLVYVIPSAMRDRCAAVGLVATDVLAALVRKGWVDRGSGRHYTRQLRVADAQGGRARVYVFRHDLMALDADDGESEHDAI